MFAVEIGKALRRKRTWAFAGVLAFLAVLPTLIALSTDSGEGPPFFEFIRRNGLYAPLTAIAISLPFMLPLVAGLLSGDSIAGEASNGTLRVLLFRPVPRTRLVLIKFASTVALIFGLVGWLVVAATISGAIGHGFRELPTLSGNTVGVGEALLRILAAGAYVGASMVALAAIGLFLSTTTDSGPGATVATVAFAIVSQILGAIDAIRWLHPWLPSHRWLGFADLFRSPVEWDRMRGGLLLSAAYTAVFVVLAVVWFRRKDIQS